MDQMEFEQEEVKVLTVTVIKASGVQTGLRLGKGEKLKLYVKLRVRSSPNGKQHTTMKKYEVDPVWNETFTFHLNPDRENTLEVTMKEDNQLTQNTTIGKEDIPLDTLLLNESTNKKLTLNKKTVLEISVLISTSNTMDLRISRDICTEEKQFQNKRVKIVKKNMSKLELGKKTPKKSRQVPVIAIMGSGGGYRAACGFSGAMVALEESGILDCSTYIAGLSGSSWYISTLYANNESPDELSCDQMATHLKTRFDTKLHSHFRMEFRKRMKEKSKTGQLVRFTDFFGMAIGHALLEKEDAKLSEQVEKVKDGNFPLPIATALRVKKDVKALDFNEWVEFTPFEYGSPGFGVFGKTSHFGGKYYKGRLVTEYGEPPLHFLQGVWGSAFSIILNSLKEDDEKRGKNNNDELVSAIKIDVDNCKTEENDSEDEDEDKNKPEDEVDNKGWVTQMLNPKNIFASRNGKAAECFDYCRGLKLKNKNGTFGGKDAVFKNKTMCVVDSGIAFNSPFPVLLRPERKVELILSFDFSQKDNGDKEPPFHELLKAEKWARENKYPFPNIKDNPVVKDSEVKDSEIRECYVFEDENDPNCPTILHFPIVNNSFREYLSPGVKREKDDDIEFANFDIFDDPDEPYSSFKFEYKPKTFERLHELMKYNTLVSIDLIKGKIIDIVKYRRKHRKYAKKHSLKEKNVNNNFSPFACIPIYQNNPHRINQPNI